MNHFLNRLIPLSFLLTFSISTTISQTIYTKDGKELGERGPLVDVMVQALDDLGYGDDLDKYCGCIVDEIFTRVTSWELEDYLERNAFEEMYMRPDLASVLQECISSSIDELEDIPMDILSKEAFVSNCVQGAMMEYDDMDSDEYTYSDWVIICTCLWTRIAANENYTVGDIMQAENENSEAYVELIMPCIAEMYEVAPDINRDAYVSNCRGGATVNLVKSGYGWKAKLEIGGNHRYFLLDTGASDLIIDSDVERDLLLDGVISRDNYIGKDFYELANGVIIEADLIRIPHIKIGGCTVYNSIVAVIPDGGMLLGTGFLDIFSDWRINSSRGQLIMTP